MNNQKYLYTKQLVLSALMAAINVIFALLSSYLLAFNLVIMLFLPLTSIVVVLNVDYRIYPIYVISTLALALLVNFAHFDNTLFFLFPLLLSGLGFGVLIKKNVPDILILLVVSLINLLTLLITIPLINLIYEIDYIATFSQMIGFNDIDFGRFILPSVLTLLAFCQTLITLIIIQSDAKVFRITLNEKKVNYVWIINLSLIVLIVLTHFINEAFALPILLFIIVLSVYEASNCLTRSPINNLKIIIFPLFFALLGFAFFESVKILPNYFGVLFGVIIVIIFDIILLNKERKAKNEKLV